MVNMSNQRRQNPPPNEVARRLRLLRSVVKPGMNGAQFAAFLGVHHARYGNAENGYPLSLGLAQTIKQRIPGISLDWLYHGDVRAVHLELAQRLSDAEASAGKSRTVAS